MSTVTSDSSIIVDALEAIRARWRRRATLRAAARMAAGLAAIWGIAWAVVWAGTLSGLPLTVAAGAAAVASGAWFLLVLRGRDPAPGDRALARHVEERHPALEDRLVTAVDVASREARGPLDAAFMADAARALGRESLDDVVPETEVRAAGLRAALAGALLLAAGVAWIGPAHRAFQVASAYLLPGGFSLHVSPGNVRLAPGQPLVISARTGVPDIVPELTIAAADRSRTLPMARAADGFHARFDAVPGSFTYRVSAAGRTSPEYRVTLLEAPRLEGIDLHYEFPPYTKLAPRDEHDGGDIYAPAGTSVRLSVRTSAATSSGALVLGTRRMALERQPGGPLTATLPVSADGSYRVALTSRDGLSTTGDTEYFIRVLDDRPPEVRIVRPASDRQVTPLEEVTVEARADDDYGIQSFDLVYTVRGGQERVVPFTGERSALTATGRHTIYLEDLGVAPGDFVTYYARARDVGRGKRSTEARSDIFFLEVAPFEQEFSAAQSQAMAAAANGRSVDDLVTAQKDVIVATWKLDRRSGAGRSAADVKTVATAQGDVRQRTERAAGAMRGPRRRPSAGSTTGPDPLSSAATAMARAEAALGSMNTGAAVAPEMEALNHLLRAQAENRRREVTRQQAGMGGGGNRAQQDLSSLFDRELKRQQQTNYETPRTAEEREPNGADDLLERLRALAARQEQLARQQDDLARSGDQLQAEERRRRLERLTREQTEVRRQAEQLAQQMQAGRQQGGASKGQQSSSGAASASGLRDASEEMQAAAGDLRREDARQASTRSANAAERLRSLEREMQGQSPDERRRALGDLQLEARQLAERQRQIGDETAEADHRQNGGDQARKLAAEQERLADRADRLEQQVDALAKSGRGKSAASLAEAGRELKEQRVGQAMRDAAQSMRLGDGAGGARAGAKAAAAGRGAARALDRLADRLADAGGQRDAAERRLSDQLSRARDVRERMGELQRQMAELQGRTPNAGRPATRQPAAKGSEAGAQRQGRSQAAGGQGPGASSPTASSGQPGTEPGSQLERLKREYNEQVREAARLRQELDGQQGARGRGDGAGSTPEGQLMVMSAPGTEAFKQDFSKWDVLHKDVTLGLERLEATLSQRLLEKALRERLAAGAADEAPGGYQDAVERYFRSIAAAKD